MQNTRKTTGTWAGSGAEEELRVGDIVRDARDAVLNHD